MKEDTVVYIISNINKSVAFEWIVEDFKKEKLGLQFILLNGVKETPLAAFLRREEIPHFILPLNGKKSLPLLWIKVFYILLKLKPKVVHTHLFEASLIGLSVAKILGIKHRIYTRHHSTYHHDYFPKAVKFDRFINALSTNIVAISKSVRSVLQEQESVAASKIELIEHGFRLDLFGTVENGRVEKLRNKLNLPKDKLVVGCIARYIEWKGIQYVIRAFAKIKRKYPNAHLLLANASGQYKSTIHKELKKLDVESYTEVVFEEDLFALYQLINVFVHTPINSMIEAFGQTYVEALAAGIPSVFSLSGIANDFIVHNKNALVVDYKNSAQIYEAISKLMEDKDLQEKLIEQGRKDVQYFKVERMTTALKQLYRR